VQAGVVDAGAKAGGVVADAQDSGALSVRDGDGSGELR